MIFCFTKFHGTFYRTKILKIVEKAGFTPDWHDGKALIHILDSLPRDEVFQGSIAELTDIALRVLHLEERRRLAFFVRRDQFNRFLSCGPIIRFLIRHFNYGFRHSLHNAIHRSRMGATDTG